MNNKEKNDKNKEEVLMNKFQEKVFNDLWNYMGRYYIMERQRQEGRRNMNPKTNVVTPVCCVTKKAIRQIRGPLNIEEVRRYYYINDKNAMCRVITIYLDFYDKKIGDWHKVGKVLPDYFIIEYISDEDAEELDKLLQTDLLPYFGYRYKAYLNAEANRKGRDPLHTNH